MKSTREDRRNIVFFDGMCNLCNHSVDLLLRLDRQKSLFFAPLQGSTATKLLADLQIVELNSMVFYTYSQSYEGSSAILRCLLAIGGFWKIAYLGLLVPPFLRNFFYYWVARHRYFWFGQKSTCRLPTPEEQARFLD